MLTKISIWDDKHGWQRITAAKATKLFPHGLSKESKMLLCEVCNQHAALTKQGSYEPYFTHTRSSGDCDEKAISNSKRFSTNPLSFSLPLRIKFTDNKIDVSIGFLPLPLNVMESAEKTATQVSILAEETNVGTYSINPLRFSANTITYYSVGNNISNHYRLSYKSNYVEQLRGIKYYWPEVIDGIDECGTLFGFESGKRIPHNADIIVGQKYYLIVERDIPVPSDVSVKKLQMIGRIRIYSVCAEKMSKSADCFFRKFGGRLTDNPATLMPVYPFGVVSSNLFSCAAEKVWLYKSDGFVDIYPQGRSLNHPKQTFSIVSRFEQLVSISRFENRTNVLRYFMLRKVDKDKMPMCVRTSEAKVFNAKGELVAEGQYATLPVDRAFSTEVEFDGYIGVFHNDFLVSRVNLKSGKRTFFDVERERTYRIFQGLDCIYELTFTHKRRNHAVSDSEMYHKLNSYTGQSIEITHAFGSIAVKLGDMPRTKAWLAKQLRTNQIDRRAKELLQKRYGG